MAEGEKVMVFVNKKSRCDDISSDLCIRGTSCQGPYSTEKCLGLSLGRKKTRVLARDPIVTFSLLSPAVSSMSHRPAELARKLAQERLTPVTPLMKSKHIFFRERTRPYSVELPPQSIHGDREQSDREQAIEDLKTGEVSILIATDVASRGIDIQVGWGWDGMGIRCVFRDACKSIKLIEKGTSYVQGDAILVSEL